MKTRKTIAMLLAVGVLLALAGWAQAALVLTQGGYDAQTVGPIPVAAFTSPLGAHSHSQTHNTAWTASGNHMWSQGVSAAPVAGGPAAATSNPNISWHNSGTNGTQTQTLGGTMDANTQYTLSFDGAIRDQGQFGGGGANIISNLGSFDLEAIAVGSVDGVLAQQDFAPSFTSTGAWQNFSLSWDSTGKDLSQTVTVAIGAADSGSTSLQFLTDTVTLSSGPAPPPAPLSLLNGGFDDDGTLSGVQTSITGWNLTKFNAGWQTGSPWGAAPPPTSGPNVALLNSNVNPPGAGTELMSTTLSGAIGPGTIYTLSFDAAVREQGQFGGPANTIASLGTYDLNVEIVGSVDGVLASVDAVPLITSVDTWFPGSLVWDSTGATPGQTIEVVLGAANTGSTHLQFVMDSLALTAQQPVIPEPASAVLVFLGLGAVATRVRRRLRVG